MKSSGRYKLEPEKIKKESTLVAQHCASRAARRRELQSKAGKLWTEEDFDELGLDKFGVNVAKLKAPPPTKPKKIFRAWNERWENRKLKKRDDEYEARLLRKYEGLQWRDPDKNDILVSSHPKQMYYWQEKRGSPRDYYVVGRLKGYNVAMDLEKQDDDVWDFWERNEQLYECIIEYYKNNPDASIVIYEKGGNADSEVDEEGEKSEVEE